MQSYTVAALMVEFFAVIEHTNAPGTVANYRRHLTAWEKTVEGKTVDELRPLDLLKWGHTWHQIQAVQRLFGWAVDEAEIVVKHPFRRVKRPPLGERKRTVPRAIFVKLCRQSDDYFRVYLLALRETIGRPQEIRALIWEQLRSCTNADNPLLELGEGKAFFELDDWKARKRMKDSSKPRVILVSKRLGRLLLRLARRKGVVQGSVFTNSKGEPWTSNAVRLRMKRLRRRLGLLADRRGENIVAYSIRHTQATAAAARGVRDRILAEIMGHTTTRCTARYQHLETEHLRAAFEKLGPLPR